MSEKIWRWLAPVALAAAVGLVYLLSPNATPFDSRWTVHTALSLIHEGDADLNEYTERLEAERWYAIECVFEDGRRVYPMERRAECAGGRLYHYYPIAAPVVMTPAVGGLEWMLRRWRPLAERVEEGPLRRFLSGDLAGSSMMTELVLASGVVTLAALLVYLFGCELGGRAAAAGAALVFAFCTPAWSIGSRALWMHGFSMVLLTAGLWALWKGRWAAGGAIFVLAFFIRPTNVVGLGCAGMWALSQGWRPAAQFALGGLPVAASFVGLNEWIYGTALAPFFQVSRPGSYSMFLHPRIGEALAGNLVSPARGLLVYSPFVVFSAWGVWQWMRDGRLRRLGWFTAAACVGQYLLICSYEDWFGGECYGPRYLSDLSPLYALALLPALGLGRRGKAAAGALLAVSLFMHAQGALCWPCVEWNAKPTRVRENQWRLWDWKDPAFLRNLRGGSTAAE